MFLNGKKKKFTHKKEGNSDMIICILDVGICTGFGLSASVDNLGFFTDVSDEHSGRSLQLIKFV